MAMLKSLAFFVFFSKIYGILAANGNPSFTFNGFKESPSFDEDIALFGDSKVVNGGSSIQLTDSVSQSEGRVIYRKPINLFEGRKRNSGSFSTYFSFSMSNKNNSVLAFVMVPSGLDLRLFGNKDNSSSSPLGFLLGDKQDATRVVSVEYATRVVSVEFSTSKKGSRVGIIIGNPKSSSSSSFHSFQWNNGEKLHCWIDYEASSKRIEVFLSKSNPMKPINPMIYYSIDLMKLWKDGKFMMGLSSINGNSSHPQYLQSWRFNLRSYPLWMHSQPLDPPNEELKTKKEDLLNNPMVIHKKSECIWRMISALILGGVCGTLGAMLVVYLWSISGGRRPMVVVPVEAMVVDEEEGKK